MKATPYLLVLAFSSLLSPGAGAQQPPSAEHQPPNTPVAAPQPKASPAEKQLAKTRRQSEGAQAAGNPRVGEGDPVPTAASKVTKDKRQQARAARKAEAARANKAGEITSRGELGSAK